MYTDGQIYQIVHEHTGEVAALWESTKSAHKRIDKVESTTQYIHQLATSIEGLTVQMKHQKWVLYLGKV